MFSGLLLDASHYKLEFLLLISPQDGQESPEKTSIFRSTLYRRHYLLYRVHTRSIKQIFHSFKDCNVEVKLRYILNACVQMRLISELQGLQLRSGIHWEAYQFNALVNYEDDSYITAVLHNVTQVSVRLPGKIQEVLIRLCHAFSSSVFL